MNEVMSGNNKSSPVKNGMLKSIAHFRKGNEKARQELDKGRSFAGRATGYEQHIAVFGESGSGKTTLLCVFYGKQQSARFVDESGYELLANDASQGNQLLSLYNQVRDSIVQSTRLKSTRYEFSVRPATREKKSKNVIRLVWHDYPGEWLTEEKGGMEGARRKETFENLVKADVAYFLVDAQKLKSDGGKYLKRLFGNFKDLLARMHDDYAAQGKLPFHYFPRLWYICLSKADLLPDWTVQRFKQELEFANEEVFNVERTLNAFVSESRNVDFRSGYLLLSSLKVNSDSLKIENWDETKGVDAIVPLSFYTPIFRAFKWAKVKGVSSGVLRKVLKVGGKILSSLGPITAAGALLIITSVPWIGWALAAPVAIAALLLSSAGFLLEAAGSGFEAINENEVKKLNGLKLMLKRFQLKIIEVRAKAICEIKDIEEYISQQH